MRWIEGWHDELVCQLRFKSRQALFLASVADAHESLQRAFELADFQILIVEGLINPTCPDCQGGGQIYIEAQFYSTHLAGTIACETCGGSGEV